MSDEVGCARFGGHDDRLEGDEVGEWRGEGEVRDFCSGGDEEGFGGGEGVDGWLFGEGPHRRLADRDPQRAGTRGGYEIVVDEVDGSRQEL